MKYLVALLLLVSTATAETFAIPSGTRVVTPGGVTYRIPEGSILETPEPETGLIPEFPDFPPRGSKIVTPKHVVCQIIYGARLLLPARQVPGVIPPPIIVEPVSPPTITTPIIVDPIYVPTDPRYPRPARSVPNHSGGHRGGHHR